MPLLNQIFKSGAIRLRKCLKFCQNELNDELLSIQAGLYEFYDTLLNDTISPAGQKVVSSSILRLELQKERYVD